MRPLSMTLSAFGPYAGVAQIPMRELGEKGLYLITGDTGSGKSTIFDAICYALFGEPSGTSKDASMLRSKYANPATPTEVELVFLHAGKQYEVRRNPEYMRPAKRGEKLTRQPADASLFMPDGQVITKTRDVNAAIEGILGINKEQFSQIAMLAQGDFLKLLLADTKERMRIFRELFQTQRYQALQNMLEDKRKEIYGQVEAGRSSIRQYIDGILGEQDDVLAIDIAKAKDGLLTADEVLELLDELIAEDTLRKQQLDASYDCMQTELEQVNTRLGAAETRNKARAAQKHAGEVLAAEEPKTAGLSRACGKAREALNQKEALEKEAHQIENELNRYEITGKLEREIAESEETLRVSAQNLARAKQERDDGQTKLRELKAEQESILHAEAEYERRRLIDQTLAERKKVLDAFGKDLGEYHTQCDVLAIRKTEYQKDKAFFLEQNARYESMEQAFLDGQAGFLAGMLTEGEKCPVCGSRHHPAPAVCSEKIPGEEERKEARKKTEEARAKQEADAAEVSGLIRGLEIMESALRKTADTLFGTQDLIRAEKSFLNMQTELAVEKKAAEEAVRREGKKVQRKTELDKQIPGLDAGLAALAQQIITLTAAVSEKEALNREKAKQLAEQKKDLRFESREAAQKEMEACLLRAKQLQTEYDLALEALHGQQQRIASLQAEINALEKTIRETEAVDEEKEKIRKKDLEEALKSCIDRRQAVAARMQTNRDIRENISKRAADVFGTEKKLQWVKALSDTANGKLAGKEKIMLETYIQATYFDRIINRANLRFMTMSDGQYELIRLREPGNVKKQSGLDLGVIDHYNGTQRSVKTLSGGESFMASLSLALGLSDEVQASAGGIRIDTMFVDEGFGSLDPDALDMAYKALAGLTEGNRLVGIISHVADLKDRIDKQIVVTKEKSGGSKVRIVV